MLSIFEPRRHIQLTPEIQLQPIHKQITHVQSLVKQHYIDCDGSLDLWGDIQRYIFFYAEGCKLALSIDGVVLEEDPNCNISKASFSIKNTDITKTLVNK